MYSRREVLKLGMLAGINLPLPFTSSGTHPEPVFNLFVDAGDLDRLRTLYATAPMFQDLRDTHEALDMETAYRFIQEEVRLNDHLFHMRRLTDTASQMAFQYLMTENRAFADLAIATVETIMRFERWDYFLDGDIPIAFQRGSRATTAVSLCVDWLGDLIPPDTRNDWLQIMARRGCEPCYQATYGMRYPDRVSGWAIDPTSTYFEHRPGDRGWDLSNWPYIFDQNNLKAEPAAALAIGSHHLRASTPARVWIPNDGLNRRSIASTGTAPSSRSTGRTTKAFPMPALPPCISCKPTASSIDLRTWTSRIN